MLQIMPRVLSFSSFFFGAEVRTKRERLKAFDFQTATGLGCFGTPLGGRTCFCLVAGGLGERLGYPGIKIPRLT